jgi:2-polyprenyl-3-methyl-5-hydroxy-6-metoxy-1,4-benzoquinol methylase
MTDSSAEPNNESAAVHFDRIYRGEPVAHGLNFERVPWDIGRPQPLLMDFEKAGSITGEVLDAGCGPGDTAIYLAGLGYRVTGLDVAPTAIDEARRRAAERGVAVVFEVSDATAFDGYDGRFDTVVSSQLVHCLNYEQRRAHVAALARVLTPGGRLIQFSANFADGVETFGLHSISEEELRRSFMAPDWSIVGLRAGHMEGGRPPETLLSQFALNDFRPEFTADGLMLMPVWALEAQRR